MVLYRVSTHLALYYNMDVFYYKKCNKILDMFNGNIIKSERQTYGL